jgi:hypothetical protein
MIRAKNGRNQTMKAEMNPQEVAEELDLEGKYHNECGELHKAHVHIAAASILRRVASGELVPVVHGRWIGHFEDDSKAGPGQVCCSNCGVKLNVSFPRGNCCPSCGALMDGKDDSHETNTR